MSGMKRWLCAGILFVLLVFVFHSFSADAAGEWTWYGARIPAQRCAIVPLESNVRLMLSPVQGTAAAHARPMEQHNRGHERLLFLFLVFALFACRRALCLWQRRAHSRCTPLRLIDFYINHPQLAPPRGV